jgi:hypothetical protein
MVVQGPDGMTEIKVAIYLGSQVGITGRNRVGRGESGAEAKRPLVTSLTSFGPRRLRYDSKNGCENMNAQSMGCTDS